MCFLESKPAQYHRGRGCRTLRRLWRCCWWLSPGASDYFQTLSPFPIQIISQGAGKRLVNFFSLPQNQVSKMRGYRYRRERRCRTRVRLWRCCLWLSPGVWRSAGRGGQLAKGPTWYLIYIYIYIYVNIHLVLCVVVARVQGAGLRVES